MDEEEDDIIALSKTSAVSKTAKPAVVKEVVEAQAEDFDPLEAFMQGCYAYFLYFRSLLIIAIIYRSRFSGFV